MSIKLSVLSLSYWVYFGQEEIREFLQGHHFPELDGLFMAGAEFDRSTGKVTNIECNGSYSGSGLTCPLKGGRLKYTESVALQTLVQEMQCSVTGKKRKGWSVPYEHCKDPIGELGDMVGGRCVCRRK